MTAEADRAGRHCSFGTARTNFKVLLRAAGGAADSGVLLGCKPADAAPEVNQENIVKFGGDVGDGVGSNVFSPAFITYQHLR
jgi:hypothetical protein